MDVTDAAFDASYLCNAPISGVTRGMPVSLGLHNTLPIELARGAEAETARHAGRTSGRLSLDRRISRRAVTSQRSLEGNRSDKAIPTDQLDGPPRRALIGLAKLNHQQHGVAGERHRDSERVGDHRV